MFLTIGSKSMSKVQCKAVVTSFCRDNNVVIVNDLTQIICDYYDDIDQFDESCRSRHLTITNRERTQIRVSSFHNEPWDDCELKFICGTKKYFINNNNNNNTIKCNKQINVHIKLSIKMESVN